MADRCKGCAHSAKTLSDLVWRCGMCKRHDERMQDDLFRVKSE